MPCKRHRRPQFNPAGIFKHLHLRDVAGNFDHFAFQAQAAHMDKGDFTLTNIPVELDMEEIPKSFYYFFPINLSFCLS